MHTSAWAPLRSLTTAFGWLKISECDTQEERRIHLRCCCNEDFSPCLQVDDPSFEVVNSHAMLYVNFEEIFEISFGDRIYRDGHEFVVPAVFPQSLLEDLMEHRSINR